MERWNDPKLETLINKATFRAYPPGSTFKIITSIAGLESWRTIATRTRFSTSPQSGEICLMQDFLLPGKDASIKDTAPPGDYEYERFLPLQQRLPSRSWV